jgi:hypothetical protein
LPAVDDVAVRVDSLASDQDSWRVYLTAEPDWWIRSADGNLKWSAWTVHAEDDLGGLYLSGFGGSHRVAAHEELGLRFRPRLNPLARAVTLVFTRGAEQVTVQLRLG